MDLIKKQYLFPFEKLEVWQLALTYSIYIRRLITSFPKEEMFALTDQLRRSSGSVVSNIAEGSVRKKPNDKARFFEISYGSLMESMSQSIESHLMGYISEEKLQEIRMQVHELSNKLNAFYNQIN